MSFWVCGGFWGDEMEWNGKENLSKRVREYKYSRKIRTPGQLTNPRPNNTLVRCMLVRRLRDMKVVLCCCCLLLFWALSMLLHRVSSRVDACPGVWVYKKVDSSHPHKNECCFRHRKAKGRGGHKRTNGSKLGVCMHRKYPNKRVSQVKSTTRLISRGEHILHSSQVGNVG
jgi:hypothetical protein